MAQCLTVDCQDEGVQAGRCYKHYARIRRNGTDQPSQRSQAPLGERLSRRTKKGSPDECWEWTGGVAKNGYANIWSLEHRKKLYAHRVAYELANGSPPDGMVVMHACDNRRCVNPAHLIAGTQRENIRDMVSKGRNFIPRRGVNYGA